MTLILSWKITVLRVLVRVPAPMISLPSWGKVLSVLNAETWLWTGARVRPEPLPSQGTVNLIEAHGPTSAGKVVCAYSNA